jgi:ornithine cyclodeaminase/alanine dehydrogenase-like protein (mu-crystallin family)
MDATTKYASFRAPAGNGALAPAKTIPLTRSAVGRLRSRDDEIIVFDSSGTALQDVAAAAAVYRRALGQQQGVHFSFNA